jgi:hypothetical protein
MQKYIIYDQDVIKIYLYLTHSCKLDIKNEKMGYNTNTWIPHVKCNPLKWLLTLCHLAPFIEFEHSM